MTNRRALARAGVVVTLAFFLSRVLGWVRVAVLAGVFGAHSELDTFYAAFRIPDLIFQLVAAGALSSALIPIVAGLLATDEDERAWRVVSTVTNLMMLALLALAVIVALAAPILIPAITPGFDAVATERTIQLTRIMLLSPILLALSASATSVLNAQNRFGAAAAAPLLYNLAIIVAAIVLTPMMGVEALAIGVVIGALLNLVVQLGPLLAGGFRYEPIVEISDGAARQALYLMAPRAIGLGVSQLTFVVSTTLASGLGPGAITDFNNAFTILQIPIGIIGVPLGVVVFPSLSRELARGSLDEYTSLLTRSLRLLIYVMLPITALGIVLRTQVVTILFPVGLDRGAIDLTASTLLYFLLGLAAHSLIAVLARAFYAARDTRTPVAAAVLAVVVNVTLGIVLVGPLGLPGLAIAIAIGAWAEAAMLVWILRGRLRQLRMRPLARAFLESGIASAVAAVAAVLAFGVLDGFLGEHGRIALFVESVMVTAVGGAVFLGLSLALRIPELPTIVAVMGDLLHRPGRA